jgi:hypothetical protein
MTHWFTFSEGHGRASYSGDAYAIVGDRKIPAEIFVHVQGGLSEPDFSMKIEVRQGIPVCTEVTLTARPDGPEVRDKDLKYLHLSDWLENIVARASMKSGGVPDDPATWGWGKPVKDSTALADIRRVRSGRSRMSRERLEKVADVYRQHVDARPTEAVARAFGVEHRTAARYVQQARAADLLPPTTPGKKKA